MLFRDIGLRVRSAASYTIPVGAALALLVAVTVAPWLRRDLNWEDIADAPNHLIRIYAIGAALQTGDWYPRWLPDLYLGYGYPLLNYYAPGLYYLAALLRGLGMTVYSSFQWSGVLAVALGAAGAFALLRALTGSVPAAVLGAAVFVLSPYPFLTNLYVRAALPEALALGLLPWLFFTAYRTWYAGGRWPAAFTAATALLLLTHNLSTLIYAGLLALWQGWLMLTDRRSATAGFRRLVPAGVMGASLAAFFWIPAFLETGYVQLDLARGGIYDFRTWLFDPLRSAPVAASVPFDYTALGKAVPERPSLTQGFLWVASLVSALLAGRRRSTSLFFLLVAAAFWFLCTTWSAPLWDRAPLLATVQFPWRLYGPMALCLAAGAGIATSSLALTLKTRGTLATLLMAAPMAALTCLLAFDALALRPVLTTAEPAHDVDARDLVAKEYNRYGAGTTSGGEFLPRTVGWPVEGATRRGIRIYEEAYAQAGWQAGAVRILDGRASVPQIWREPNGIAATIDAEVPTRLGIHQLAFPGWRGYLDGQPVQLGIARYEPANASLGFMTIDVPAGRHQVDVRFGPTRARHAGNAVTAAAVVAAALALRRPRLAVPLSAVAALLSVAAGEYAARPVTARAGNQLVAVDVLSQVQQGSVQSQAPSGTGTGVLPPFLDIQYRRAPTEERRWLYMHPPSAVTVQLRVPPDAYFQAGLALDPDTWSAASGDGVRFLLDAETASGRVSLLDRHVNPRARGEERTWNDVWVSLHALAGQDVRLTLRTEHGTDPTFDWAGWSSPQVVVYRASRPHPGAPHKW